MYDFLWNLGSFIVVLGILITVHEYGHFAVARLCGVKVLRFSVGFGKPLWSRTGQDGTEYVVATIPLGGYVRMLDGRVDDMAHMAPAERDSAFDRKNVWQRIAIVAAGPLANLLFAVAAFYLVLLLGTPAARPVVGAVEPGSIAEQAGLQPLERIVAVDGEPVADWESLNLAIAGRIGENTSLRMQVIPADNLISAGASGFESSEQRARTAASRELTLSLAEWVFDPDEQSAPQSLGITLWRPSPRLELSQVSEQGAGALAGLQPGDRLLSVDKLELADWSQFVTHVQQHPDQMISLGIERGGEQKTVRMIPASRQLDDGSTVGYLGVAPVAEPWPENYRFEQRLGPLEAIPGALDKTWQLVVLSIRMIGKLLIGDVALEHLSGPIAIAQGAGMTAGFGLVSFISFMALISVNLGIINLLPLPVLDGGHLSYFAIELVRGRPVSEKAQEIGYRIGSALLLALMSVAIFNDVMRL